MNKLLLIVLLIPTILISGCVILGTSTKTEENIQTKEEQTKKTHTQEKTVGDTKTTITNTQRVTTTYTEKKSETKKETDLPVESSIGFISNFFTGGSGMWTNLLIGLLGGVGTGLLGYMKKKAPDGKMEHFKFGEVLEDALTGLLAGGGASAVGVSLTPETANTGSIIMSLLQTWGFIMVTDNGWKIAWRNIITRATPLIMEWIKPKKA